MERKLTLHFFFLFIFFLLQLSPKLRAIALPDCSALQVTSSITPACHSGSAGEAVLNIQQGMPPYQVKWNDGSNTLSRRLPAGEYKVQVVDALGCEAQVVFSIPSKAPIQTSVQVDHTSKTGKSNGSIDVRVTGGAPPYHYSWIANNGFQFPADSKEKNKLVRLPSGVYKIVIFDAAGCYSELVTEIR